MSCESRITEESIRSALSRPEMKIVAGKLRSAAVSEADLVHAVEVTAVCAYTHGFTSPLVELCSRFEPDTAAVSQYALIATSLRSLTQIPGLPVAEGVKQRIHEYFRFFAEPEAESLPLLAPDSNAFGPFCRIATLLRFPGVQNDFEVSGIPRSWLPKVRWIDLPAVCCFIACRLRGFGPCFTTHTSFRLPLKALLPKEHEQDMCLLARSMELQPKIRGYFARSWLLDPDLGRVCPHLAFPNHTGDGYRVLRTTMGWAPTDSGYLEGVRTRRLYNEGKLKPRMGVMLWARADILRWADAQAGMR